VSSCSCFEQAIEESQEHSQLTALSNDEAWLQATSYLSKLSELNYLSLIVCRMFEVPSRSSTESKFSQ
jgi:hypothetical protein